MVIQFNAYSFTPYLIVHSKYVNSTSKISLDDIMASLPTLDNTERTKLQNALFDLQNDLDLHQAISEGLDDMKNGRVSSHDFVMSAIKEKHGV